MDQLVATNSQTKTVHKVGATGTLVSKVTNCGLRDYRKANAMQIETGRRCPNCFTDAAPAPRKTTSKKPAAPKKAKPAAPVADTTADRKISSWTYTIDAEQLEATLAKFEKINTRAAKKGMGGEIKLTSCKEVTKKKQDALTGLTVEYTMYEIEIGGTAPAYNGWQFIATLDWDQHAGLIVRAAPGVVQVDRDRLKQGWCDHCKTNRGRRVTYVVRDMNNGQQLQVGRSCIKDFTGWQGTVAWLDTPGADDHDGEWFGPAGRIDYTVETVLAYTWAVIKLHGWVPASHYDQTPTRSLVSVALYPSPKSQDDIKFARSLAPLADEAMGRAKEIRAFILSGDFGGDSDYVVNLKAVCAGERVSVRNFGLVVSAPQAHARFQEQTLLREKAAKLGEGSEWFGVPAEKGKKSIRHILDVTVAGVRYLDGEYGTTTLYTLVTEDGTLFKWFASDDKLGEDEGARFRIKATVKKHDEYNGTKQTVLTRCNVVEELPATV